MPQIAPFRNPANPGAIMLGGRQIPIRVWLFWAGLTFWIGNMVLRTGTSGLAALWASLFFLTEILVITSATRTITLDRVASFYCMGGAMMAVMWLVAYAFTRYEPNVDAVSRQFFVPTMEELLKLAPVAFILWRQRKARLWTTGASDVLLMAAASGAGFGLVEEAYIRHALGTPHALDWLPITRINGVTLTAGHGIWTSLAGATLGLALLWRPRRPIAYLLGGGGVLWSIFDHSHHNYGVNRTGFSVDFFNFITGHGWYSLYFFLLGAIAVVGSDLYAVRGMLSLRPQLKLRGLKPPKIRREGNDLKGLWAFLLDRRALAYVLFRCQRSSGLIREEFARLAAVLEGHLLSRPSSSVSPQNPSAAAADLSE